jgi:hypothetical protein
MNRGTKNKMCVELNGTQQKKQQWEKKQCGDRQEKKEKKKMSAV